MNAKKILPGAIVALLFWSGALSAQYTIVLKNGRRITVQSYREEGGMIKFQGLGGEIGLGKNQIQTILKPGQKEERGMVVPPSEAVRAAPVESKPEEKEALAPKAPAGAGPEEKAPSPEQKQAEERAKEEKEYQKRVQEITGKLKAARDRYLIATRGTSGPEPTVPTTQEEMRTRADDLISRLRDVQQGQTGVTYEPGLDLPKPATGAPPTTVQTGPIQARPQAGPAPPGYTERQKELSDLRNEIYQLEQERDRLIQEMKQKGFETGALFLD